MQLIAIKDFATEKLHFAQFFRLLRDHLFLHHSSQGSSAENLAIEVTSI
jgi:hypothetical protein